MNFPKLLLAGMIVIGLAVTLHAPRPQAFAAEKQGGIKHAPVTYSNPSSGKQMFQDYCAACHGPEGKGDGPAVEFLKTPPPDLQTLAQRNKGKYPNHKVSAILQFGPGSRAHGTSDMPIWGRTFRSQDANSKVSELRIYNLSAFVESLQKK
jgi:mono/diheme cytochrome c family protein